MLGGIFEKNNIKDKIQNFNNKIIQQNFWKDKISAQKILKEKDNFVVDLEKTSNKYTLGFYDSDKQRTILRFY